MIVFICSRLATFLQYYYQNVLKMINLSTLNIYVSILYNICIIILYIKVINLYQPYSNLIYSSNKWIVKLKMYCMFVILALVWFYNNMFFYHKIYDVVDFMLDNL